MVAHNAESEHAVALSFSDMSFWCYLCDSYVVDEAMNPIRDVFYEKKFGNADSITVDLNSMTISGNEDSKTEEPAAPEEETKKPEKPAAPGKPGAEEKKVDENPTYFNDRTIEELADRLKTGFYKNVAIMAGAGISVSAGIPDFRSPGSGLYSRLEEYNLPDPQSVFEIKYFKKNPEPFFKLSQQLIGDFKPTPTHYFLKLLEDKGILHNVFT
jgi:hypothetical protein